MIVAGSYRLRNGCNGLPKVEAWQGIKASVQLKGFSGLVLETDTEIEASEDELLCLLDHIEVALVFLH